MKPLMKLSLICTALFSLNACQQKEEKPPVQPAPAPAEQVAPQSQQETVAPPANNNVSGDSLIRQQASAPTPIAAAPTIQAMQSKLYNETTVHLTKARVAGPILTVEFVFEPKRKPDGKYGYVDNYQANFEELAYIDEASAQKVSVLQDGNGKYSGSPSLGEKGQKLYISGSSHMMTVTLKYPAPPAETQTISITLPKVGSFDGIAITR